MTEKRRITLSLKLAKEVREMLYTLGDGEGVTRECFVENFDRWSQSCFDLFAELNERFPEGERY